MAVGALLVLPVLAGARDITGDEHAHLIRLIIEARPRAAAAFLDSLESECGGEPFFLLARGRMLIEDVSIDDLDKENTRARSQPALAMFQEVIDVCDLRLENGGDQESLRLFRGWAWMVRAQIHAIGRSFWSAGREAGRGKNDLEFYLERHPDDPVANGLLGAFLYFTDAVPDIFQFLSKLVRMPTGDRELGLVMIDKSVASDSPKLTDYYQLQANVNVFFEGRFEVGLPLAEFVHDNWPAYARNVLPVIVVRIWAPGRQAELADRLSRTQEIVAGLPAEDVDHSSLLTARAYDAWAERFLLGPGRAAPLFRALEEDDSGGAAWIRGFARLQLAQMAAEAGRFGDARRLCELVLDDPGAEPLADPTKALLEALQPGAARDSLPDDWIAAVHTTPVDSLVGLAARFDARGATSLRAAFYAAECRLRLGDLVAASNGFRNVVGREAPPWLHTYRMIAAMRVAEIKAAGGSYRSASRWYDRALENFQEEYRVDWVMKGRRRYLEELHEAGARLPGEPVLFAASP